MLKEFLNESRTLQSLRHPNICLFYGMCTQNVTDMAIVMEYCQYGTLKRFLQNKKYKVITSF